MAEDKPEVRTSADNSNSGLFGEQHRHLALLVIDNWINLKENSNAITWKNKFLEHNLLCEKDIEVLGTKVKRSELAEWLLMKALPNVKRSEDIGLFNSVVFKDVRIKDIRRWKAYDSQEESTEKLREVREILLNNLRQIKDLLSREDAISIKDHLVQDRIISLTDNEELLKKEKRFHDRKSSLISEVMDIIISKLQLGSYQCFIESLETISATKRRQITQRLKNFSTDDRLPGAADSTRIEHMKSTFYDKDIEMTNKFCMTIEAKNQTGRDHFKRLQSHPETVNRILSSNLAASTRKISEGSLVIHFQMMEKNMQGYIKECLKKGKVTNVVQLLFSEICMKDLFQAGPLRLKVKIEVNEDNDVLKPSSKSSSDILMFLVHNRSFLVEEMDTDAMEKNLKKTGISIPSDVPYMGRKEKADQIIDFIVLNHFQKDFLNVIEMNEGNTFSYLHHRLETYKQVYKADLTCMRKNILLQFEQIVRHIDVDDIRDVLIDRNTIEEHTVYDIDNTKGKGMATVLLKILQSGDAVRAFVDALFIMEHFLATELLSGDSELTVEETDSRVEIGENSPTENLMFEGYFHVFFERKVDRLTCKRYAMTYQRMQLQIKKEIKQLEKELINWFVDAKAVIAMFKVLARKMDVHFKRISNTQIGGSVGLAGSAICSVGIALLPIMFEVSVSLTIAGGLVAGIGGVTVLGSLNSNYIISTAIAEVNRELSKYSAATKRIKRLCFNISERLSYFGPLECRFRDWVLFWKLFVHGQKSNPEECDWTETLKLISDDVESTAMCVGGRIGAEIKIDGAGANLDVASGFISLFMSPWNVYSLVETAIDVHKQKMKYETFINSIPKAMMKDLPTETNIRTMIRWTIKNMQV